MPQKSIQARLPEYKWPCSKHLLQPDVAGRSSTEHADSGVTEPFVSDDVYGVFAANLLASIQALVPAMAAEFVSNFYSALLKLDDANSVLTRLTTAEFAQLQRRHTEYLVMLTSADLDADTHRQHARHAGWAHAHVGVDVHWLIEAYGIYQRKLECLLENEALDGAQHSGILRVLASRLLVDLAVQSAEYRRTEGQFSAALAAIHSAVQTTDGLPDLYSEILRALVSVDGTVAAFAGRMGINGLLEIEASEGRLAQTYLAAMHGGTIPPIRVESENESQLGPIAQAWATGEIQVVDAYALDSRVEQWRAEGLRLGFRAAAMVPLVDDDAQTIAVISLYADIPGAFSGSGSRSFLDHVRQAVGPAVVRRARGRVIPFPQRQRYAERLRAGHVEMLYQPVIALNDGRLLKVEALARLIEDNGSLVAPATFLPALGSDDLLRLFEVGIHQACANQGIWARDGMRVPIALNLPPQAIGDRRYHDALFSALKACEADAGQIELEILESADGTETALRDNFFSSLRELGIRIVQDDLGSGHSSLLRMESMPFDGAKIDQGLVLRAVKKSPQRALEFIHHLTELAHALGVSVTVEGLEDAGLIEAAAILGADAGQGYGIARPMRADALATWWCAFAHSVDVQHPRTPLGALAGYLLWDRQLLALRRWPALMEDFIRTPCMVQKYLHHARLEDPSMQRLLHRHHALALGGLESKLFARSRRELIGRLSALVRETDSPNK